MEAVLVFTHTHPWIWWALGIGAGWVVFSAFIVGTACIGSSQTTRLEEAGRGKP
jgi:hypothetical protein